MSDETSARLMLPLLQTGQAQKEMSHNEALTLLDFAVQPAVVEIGQNTPPTSPVAGACWIVGAAPTGAWTGHAQALVGWTSGGWRFVPARVGMAVWSEADGANARFDGTAWDVGTITGARVDIAGETVLGARRPAIADPAGGTAPDPEARMAITEILVALRAHGLIAT